MKNNGEKRPPKKPLEEFEKGSRVEGRNPVIEAFRSGTTVDKVFVQDGAWDGPIRTILREAEKAGTIVQTVPKERLDAMCRTTNGFEIAEADLKIRGAGDMLGTRQSGDNRLLELVLAYPEKYSQAQKVAAELLDLNTSCPMVERVLQECG